jgi:mRNA-degrading endonuclease RelE of RelBE toxin-antitoxin system
MHPEPITVQELDTFANWADRNLSEDERQGLALYLAFHPTDGDIIPGLSGLRKLRWRRKGTGKRGGYRVIYYFHDERFPLFLFAAYSKAVQSDLSATEKKVFARIATEIKRTLKSN